MLSDERRTFMRKIIRTHYHQFSAAHIAKLCDVGHMTVLREAKSMGVRIERAVANKIINPQMDRYIKENWENKTIASMAARFGVSENVIADRAKSFGLTSKQALVEGSREDNLLFVHFNRKQMTIREMSRVSGQHPSEIKRLSSRLNKHPDMDLSAYRLREWRKNMMPRLTMLCKCKDIAKILNTTESEVLMVAGSLGLDVPKKITKKIQQVDFKHNKV